MTQKIGQDFSTSVHLSLLPGIKLARGYWQTEIRYITDVNGITTLHNSTYNHGGQSNDFYAIVGQDVRSIEFRCYRHNSFPGNPNIHVYYNLRVDRILLLNFVYKLIRSTIIT